MHMGMNEQGMLVAIKSVLVQGEQASDLLNEIRVLARYRHDNIVSYLASALVDGHVLIVMEFVPCGTPLRPLPSNMIFTGRSSEYC